MRQKEEYVSGSERRCFVVAGRPLRMAGEVPAAVAACASLIHSPFFAVDTASRVDGVQRIIEIGDGQVSDRKEWSAEKMVAALEHLANSMPS